VLPLSIVDGRKKSHSLFFPIDYPERPDLLGCYFDLVRPAGRHSKTSHKWSKPASARARRGVLVNARLRQLGF
jgi:hypothetical protein